MRRWPGLELSFRGHDERRGEAARHGSDTLENAHGLHDPRQVTTARDLAILAVDISRNDRDFEDYFSFTTYQFRKRVLKNTNTLLRKLPGTDGMKTGYVCASGYNLVNRVTVNGHRYITVVLGASSVREREAMTARMLAAVTSTRPSGIQLVSSPPSTGNAVDLRKHDCGKSSERVKRALSWQLKGQGSLIEQNRPNTPMAIYKPVRGPGLRRSRHPVVAGSALA